MLEVGTKIIRMRLDKYIWAVRLKKTRSIATKECNTNRVRLNGEISKPGKIVKPGDEVDIRSNPIWLKYKVIDLPKSRVGAKLVLDYLKDVSDPKDVATLKQIQLTNRQNKQIGVRGRPTKKDRRDLDDLFSDE